MSALALPAPTDNHGATVVPQPHGGALRPFPKGNRANPHGRPKGLNALVRKETRQGRELVQFMLDVLRANGQFAHARVPLPLRMEAATWLADRGFGRPVQTNEHTGPDGGDLRFTLRIAAPAELGEAADEAG